MTLRADLVDEARALGISLSHEFEAHLERLVAERRRELWCAQNRKAFAAYGKYFEKHRIWNEDSRGW